MYEVFRGICNIGDKYDDEFEVCPYCGYIEGTKAKVPYHIQPGTVLVFRYIVGKVLGYGSFGVTYLGWDCLLEKKIAIKEYLPNEFATRAEGTSEVTVFDGEKAQQFTMGKDKFSDEAKKLATFNKNKGIITVYDQFEDNGQQSNFPHKFYNLINLVPSGQLPPVI